jgi:hypothetical protein
MKKIKILTRSQKIKWENIRKRGEIHYSITRGVIGFGLSCIIILISFKIFFENALEKNNYELAGEGIIIIPGFLIGGYYFGKKMWQNSEKIYSETIRNKNN